MGPSANEQEILEAVAHLRECRHCRRGLESVSAATRAFFQEMIQMEGATSPYDLDEYSAALDAVLERLSSESSRLDEERGSAPFLLQEIEGYPLKQQQLIIRNSPRFQSWGFAEYLLEASRAGWSNDPGRSELLALVGFEAADQLVADGFRLKVVNDLKAEAWSYVGNCRRIQNGLRAARKAFDRAEEYLELGTGDNLERARLFDLKASLVRQQGDFENARKLLEFALSVYRAAGERRLEAKALLGFSKLLSEMGEAESRLPLLARAAELLREDGDDYLEFVAKAQVVNCLIEAGRADEGTAHLPGLRQLVARLGNRLDRLRLLWIEGRLCQALGQTELAEQTMMQARDGYADAELGYEVALISLDLAALYLETGRLEEVKELALEVVPQLAVQQIHSDAFTAIALFEQAARKERATLTLIQEVSSTIRECRDRKKFQER